jgi:hypothetical protein
MERMAMADEEEIHQQMATKMLDAYRVANVVGSVGEYSRTGIHCRS